MTFQCHLLHSLMLAKPSSGAALLGTLPKRCSIKDAPKLHSQHANTSMRVLHLSVRVSPLDETSTRSPCAVILAHVWAKRSYSQLMQQQALAGKTASRQRRRCPCPNAAAATRPFKFVNSTAGSQRHRTGKSPSWWMPCMHNVFCWLSCCYYRNHWQS